MKIPRIALTIAGSDPTGGAGFQADLRTFQSMGVYGMCIPAVLTAQNTEGVHCVHELSADFVSEQMDVLLRDIRPDAVKTGMLYAFDTIQVIADKVRQYSLDKLVIDPVTVSSTGVGLVEEKGMDMIRSDLFPLAEVITPNIYEASVFTGIIIENAEDMRKAAIKLKELGPDTVIITGGHLEGKAMDMLFDGEEFVFIENEKLEGEFHGTGCVFSASLTAGLALGYNVKEAFIKANDFNYRAMKSGISVGRGMKLLYF
jgi:hydroxymethylpyrimidine/phosphomethylpyrimidine kinase